MARNVRITVPTEIAEELVADGDAVYSLGVRGGPLGETISIAVEAINTGSALVSIAVALVTCKRLAAAILRRRRDTDPNVLVITVNVAGETRSLRVDRAAPDAEDIASEFLVAVLNVE